MVSSQINSNGKEGITVISCRTKNTEQDLRCQGAKSDD